MTLGVVRMREDCRAPADGTAACNDALIEAIRALLPHGGGRIEFEPGHYVIDKPTPQSETAWFDFANMSLELVGIGCENVTISMPYVPLELTGLRRSSVRNLKLDSARSGFNTIFRRINGLVVQNVLVAGFQSGFQIGDEADGIPGAVFHLTLRDVKFEGDYTAHNGTIVQVRNANGLTLDHVDLSGTYSSHGLHFANRVLCDTHHLSNVLIKGCNYALRAGEHAAANNLSAHGLWLDDTGTSALHLQPAAGVTLYGWDIFKLWVKSQGYTVTLDANEGGAFKNVHLYGVTLDDGYSHGPIYQGPSGSFHDVTCEGVLMR